MSASGLSGTSEHVIVAGGGFAALEVVLALRAIAGAAARVSLVSPDPVLAYRPAATLEAFSDTTPRAFDLIAIAADLGVRYHRTRVESVGSMRKQVRLASGSHLTYDTLVLAAGARATVGIPGALTFRDQRDLPRLRGLLRELDEGKVGSLAFAVPSGASWPLPLYELALLSAAHASERGTVAEITLVSPEPRPLAVFGAEASGLVAAELANRGVRFLGASAPGNVCGGGALTVQSGAAIKADRVVAVPQLRGARITGIPADRWGFVPTDAIGKVEGMADVYAAGDITTFPIKHGGLASQQSDRIAHSIAAGLGLTPHELRAKRVLEVRLIGGQRPLRLRVELDEFGQQPRRPSPRPAATGSQAGPRYSGATSRPTSKPARLSPRACPLLRQRLLPRPNGSQLRHLPVPAVAVAQSRGDRRGGGGAVRALVAGGLGWAL